MIELETKNFKFANDHWLEKTAKGSFIDYTTDMEMDIIAVIAIPARKNFNESVTDEKFAEIIKNDTFIYSHKILEQVYND